MYAGWVGWCYTRASLYSTVIQCKDMGVTRHYNIISVPKLYMLEEEERRRGGGRGGGRRRSLWLIVINLATPKMWYNKVGHFKVIHIWEWIGDVIEIILKFNVW